MKTVSVWGWVKSNLTFQTKVFLIAIQYQTMSLIKFKADKLPAVRDGYECQEITKLSYSASRTSQLSNNSLLCLLSSADATICGQLITQHQCLSQQILQTKISTAIQALAARVHWAQFRSDKCLSLIRDECTITAI